VISFAEERHVFLKREKRFEDALLEKIRDTSVSLEQFHATILKVSAALDQIISSSRENRLQAFNQLEMLQRRFPQESDQFVEVFVEIEAISRQLRESLQSAVRALDEASEQWQGYLRLLSEQETNEDGS
jgi:malate synthase